MSFSHRIRSAVIVGYSWITIIAFGGILAETIVIYPNVFHDPPASLDGANRFFTVTGPADYFPPIGAVTVAAAVTALVVLWRHRPARIGVGVSLISLVVGEFLFSVLYFWPRNAILFDEGAAVHSVEFLRQTALEFETGHWVRLAMSGATAVFAFIALYRVLTSRETLTVSRPMEVTT